MPTVYLPLLGAFLAGCGVTGAVHEAVMTPTVGTVSEEAPAVVSADPSPTIVPLEATEGPGLIERVDLSIGFKFLTSPEELPSGSLIIYEDPIERDQVNFLTWDGQTGPLLEVDAQAKSDDILEYSFLPMRESARHLVLSLLMADQDPSRKKPREFAVIDLLEQQAWGLTVTCPSGQAEYSGLESVGWGQVVHRCSDEANIVRIFPVDGYSDGSALPVPMALESSSFAVWLNETELLILRDVDPGEYCIGEVDRWQPECHSLPFAIMGASSDGIWVEIRQYSPEPPRQLERIAMIPAEGPFTSEGMRAFVRDRMFGFQIAASSWRSVQSTTLQNLPKHGASWSLRPEGFADGRT